MDKAGHGDHACINLDWGRCPRLCRTRRTWAIGCLILFYFHILPLVFLLFLFFLSFFFHPLPPPYVPSLLGLFISMRIPIRFVFDVSFIR